MRVWFIILALVIPAIPDVFAAPSQVEIVKIPAQVGTRYFDPNSPPGDRPPLLGSEEAVCAGDFLSDASVGGQVRQTDATHAKVTINRIKVTLQLNVTTWLPNNPQKWTVEHEAGHRQILEYYYRNADMVARRVAEPYIGKMFEISGPDLRQALNVAIDTFSKEITNEYNRQMPVETTQDRYDAITEHSRKEISISDAVAQALKETYPEAAKPAVALVDRPEYLAWKNFRPGSKVVYAARYWNLAGPNKFVAGPITSLKAYQLRDINAEGVRLLFSEAPTDRYGRPMPPNEWEETIAAQYDSNVSPSANQSRSAQLLTIFHQAGNLAMAVQSTPRPIETGEDTIEVNSARIATQWESATYEYDTSVWPTFKNCRLVIKLWTSDAVPTRLVRKTEERTCPLGGDQLPRVMVETYLQSFEGVTPAASK
ncbi:MAG: hypothetical protein HP491_04535 [Nitrospira sp.]|nr:hypothetical protein [Nitrospira sp.]MBH0182526.1 hypothetical protein [Nitrospira sp.]MBH0184560.1 hypothetical protein [Nitrospira sp.]